jgi:hypothetical protein
MTTEQQFRYDNDDKGVKCRYSEENGWEPIEPNCLNCGHVTDECDCGNYQSGWWVDEAKEEQKFHTKNLFPAAADLEQACCAMSKKENDRGDGCSAGDVTAPSLQPSGVAITRIAFVRSDSYNELACTLQHLGK